MNRDQFLEALLAVMEKKTHWAWPGFSQGLVAKDKLHVHLEQEYAVYVRDFPVIVARAYVQCPIAEVRRDLAENIYEEETGGLVAGRPHPELFLEYPRGLGMDLARFENVHLLPKAKVYRSLIDELTTGHGWEIATAVSTIFIEGTQYERGEIDPKAPKRPAPPLEEHPLHKHYGLPMDALKLAKAHRAVEGEHREASWRMILDHVDESKRGAVVRAMEDVLRAWSGYRDDVAANCGLVRDGSGLPRRA